MMPYIALMLTISFILYVFKTDAKRKTTVSSALWVPLIWMMFSASKPFSYWLGSISFATSEEISNIEGSPIDRFILSILILVSLFILYKRKTKCLSILKTNPLIIIWLLYCGISILWADFPSLSFKRFIKEIGLFLSVLIVLTETEPIDAVKTLIKRFSYILVPFSILIDVYFPELGRINYNNFGTITGMLNYAGVSWNKNALGRICLVSGFFFFCNLVAMRRMNKTENDKENYLLQAIFMLIIFYLLIILDSVTSLVGLIMGILIFVILGTSVLKNNVKYLGVFIITIFFVGIFLQFLFDMMSNLVTFFGRDLTITGRTHFWKDLLSLQTNPLIGVGFGSFWVGGRLISYGDYYGYLYSSHNGYITLYLELGTVGLCLLTGVIYFTYRDIKKVLSYNYDYGRFRMAFFVIVLLYNIAEDAFAKTTLIWFVFILVAMNLPKKSQLHYSGKITSLASCSPRGQQ
jgi:O-antigen ligase